MVAVTVSPFLKKTLGGRWFDVDFWEVGRRRSVFFFYNSNHSWLNIKGIYGTYAVVQEYSL